MLGGNGDEGPAGITLSSGLAMVPTSAVSGFYFGHRDSQYFGVARIGRDQLEDYADRRGIGLEEAECWLRSEEHTSELQSLMRISYAVFCLKKKNRDNKK